MIILEMKRTKYKQENNKFKAHYLKVAIIGWKLILLQIHKNRQME